MHMTPAIEYAVLYLDAKRLFYKLEKVIEPGHKNVLDQT
ncbi:hypothetical protein L3N51_01903 [Metallosphaera sp. J1]|nr:hypothetical protein [Metallosphaera javensis (ex Hofmann et al. 2022)]BCS93116.1 MAG: hypothetical protein MjAS7_1724 [Metallosphaera javensis (ex Sakai et al. 2022)]